MSVKWNQPNTMTTKNFNPNLKQDFKKFGKEVVKSDVFKKAHAFTHDSVDILSKNFKENRGLVVNEVQHLSQSVFKALNKNRFALVCGIAVIGLALGAFTIARQK